MKKDFLEQYISNHRDAFDMAVPKDYVWANIKKGLGKGTTDELEQYIEQQRDNFDAAVPSSKIWKNIETDLNQIEKGSIEEFILREREAFDTELPSSKVWENVELDLDLAEKDQLEQFITRERCDFDTAIPNLKVWANINKELGQQQAKRFTLWKSIRIAAAAIILLIVGGTVGSFLTQNPQPIIANHTPLTTPQENLINEIAPEFVEMEQLFNKEVDSKMQQLASYHHDSLVKEDLEQLDVVMEELKRELVKAPKGTEQQILNNLIKSYKTKLAILERVLERVQTNKPIKTSNHEVSI